MLGFYDEQVINGTWGEVWIDSDYFAEVISCKAEMNAQYADILRVGRLTKGKKLIGLEGTGEVKIHKISSQISKKNLDTFKAGKVPKSTIITKVSDPDNGGTERVALYNCVFEKAILADWEAQKNGEETYSFSFTDAEYLDYI